MFARDLDGAEAELRLPTLAKRVQEMAKGACNWAQVAAAAYDEFIAPLQVLGFAALERSNAGEPFRTVLSRKLPLFSAGRVGPRATIACFVEAAESPGRVVVTSDIPHSGPLACAVLTSDSGTQQLIVLTGRVPSVTKTHLGRFARHLLDLVRPIAGGAAARKPADAVSIAIRRAKREWEAVADGLPAMVGLADSTGRVLRVNRSWTRVPGRCLGSSVHSLLHDGCVAPDCQLARSMESALAVLPSRRKLIIRGMRRQRDEELTIHLRHIPARAGRGARIVFSVSESQGMAPAQQLDCDEDPAQARSQRELQRMLEKHHHLIDGQRRQFAGDLQLSLRQSLLTASLGIASAMDALRNGAGSTTLPELERSAALIQSVLRDAEGVPSPQQLSDPAEVGLAKALRAQCADWKSAQVGSDVQVNCVVDDRRVPKSLWLTISRIVHESLYGLAGPSPSGNLGITLVPGDRALLLAIEMSSRGAVATLEEFAKSPSVLMMRELAEFSGGTFHFDAATHGSVTVEVLWSRPAPFNQRMSASSPVH